MIEGVFIKVKSALRRDCVERYGKGKKRKGKRRDCVEHQDGGCLTTQSTFAWDILYSDSFKKDGIANILIDEDLIEMAFQFEEIVKYAR